MISHIFIWIKKKIYQWPPEVERLKKYGMKARALSPYRLQKIENFWSELQVCSSKKFSMKQT